MQTQCALLIRGLLDQHSDIKRVVNVGARTDVVCSYLAPKYPDVTFLSVDMHPDLESQNQYLARSANWKFTQGYAIALMREDLLRGDLVFVTSVAPLMNAEEFATFVELASQKFRCIALNEVYYMPDDLRHLMKYLFTGRCALPEDVPLDEPWCAGKHSTYMHNYPKKLSTHGFEVRSSSIVGTYQSGLMYQCVGELRPRGTGRSEF